MERIYGSTVATIVHGDDSLDGVGSVFALLLGYSRVPYAAAKDGYFFKVFARCTRRRTFRTSRCSSSAPCRSSPSFVSLGMVIDALITTRILVQFIGQIGAVTLLRRRAPDMARPYRMWLYPAAESGRAARMDLHLRDDAAPRRRLRSRRVTGRRGLLRALVVARANVALRVGQSTCGLAGVGHLMSRHLSRTSFFTFFGFEMSEKKPLNQRTASRARLPGINLPIESE